MAFCRQRECLSTVVQLLLVRSATLRRDAIKFVLRHFSADPLLRETGIVDFLLLCLDESTGMEALQLVAEIQEKNAEGYNAELDLGSLSALDCELVRSSPRIQESILLRYFPVCVTKYFVETENTKNALGVFLSHGVAWPYLIWQKDMRKLLKLKLKEGFAELRKSLREYAVTEAYLQNRKIPLYVSQFKSMIHYPQIDKEVRCGDYFLRSWNAADGPMDPSEMDGFFASLQRAFVQVVPAGKEAQNLDELEVVLKSFEIVFSKYDRVRENTIGSTDETASRSSTRSTRR